ncbi:hypothetical protein [Oerskovia jenensis]|uniref:hypothetical protein n=1 Tax=Oerskovia jenensis TaxID=162169 RepID=UPI0036DB8725
MHASVPTAPSWIAALPTDGRGFPIPAEAIWDGDVPQIEKGDAARTALLIVNSACAVCGRALIVGRSVYRAFSQRDAAEIRLNEREIATDVNGPTHLSCILYSTFACPYLAQPKAQLGADTMYAERGRRGTRPAVLGFEGYSLLVPPGAQPPLAGFNNLVEDLPYRAPQDLFSRYEHAVEEEASWLDGAPAHYWGAGTDQAALLDEAQTKVLQFARSARSTEILRNGWPVQMLQRPGN